MQRNPRTGAFQWPPQWIAYDDQGFELDWVEVAPRGVIYSWTRVWHPVHPALRDACPYIVVVVELPEAGNVRMLGNLLGDPRQDVADRRGGRGGLRAPRGCGAAVHAGAVAASLTSNPLIPAKAGTQERRGCMGARACRDGSAAGHSTQPRSTRSFH